MRRLRRKLRRLRVRLLGRPQLVVPVPVVGAHRAVDPELEQRIADNHWLWSPDNYRRGLRLKAPPDAEWAERYNEVKNGRITYRPEVAQERLLGLVNETDSLKFVVDPVVRPER